MLITRSGENQHAGTWVAMTCVAILLGSAMAFADTSSGDVRGEERESRLQQNLSKDWALGPQPARYPYYIDVWGPPLLLAAARGITEFALEPPRNPRWTGTSAFDDEIRDGLKGGSSSARNNAAIAGDVLFGGVAVAVGADLWRGRSQTPFLRGLAADATWFFADSVANGVAKVSAGRERPYVDDCEIDPGYSDACDSGRDDNTSFFSGHTSGATTLAGRLCSRHSDLVSWDGLWCIGGIGAAVATGLMRITADEHYATDVITGWASGALFGFLLPRYLEADADPVSGTDDFVDGRSHLRAVSPIVSTAMLGLRYEIRF